jgi:phospholipid/cholesterol/gamma-HCH transport system permease protein
MSESHGSARAALHWFTAWGRAGRFALRAAAAALSPETYSPETRTVAVRQIYFTAWQLLLGFTLFSALLSLVVIQITVSAARTYGLADYALELVFRVLVLELLPFGTALIVALRSGSALSAEVALMHATGELEALRAANIDPLKREFVPRVVGAAISVASLTVITCAIALVIAYVVMYGFSPWGFEDYTREIGTVFDLPSLAGFMLKSMVFGVAVAVIPISAGIDATASLKSAPLAVMGGMVRLILALALIEILSLAVKYV